MYSRRIKLIVCDETMWIRHEKERRQHEGMLHCDAGDAGEDTVHGVLYSLEPRHTTTLTLDMLAQPTKGDEVGLAGTERTPIDFLLVARASQVTVQVRQCPELGVTKNTFKGSPVPRLLCRDKLNVGTFASSDEPRWVGNHVRAIVGADPVVNDASVDA